MLTQLSTVKSRLAIDQLDLQHDQILLSAITGFSARFDSETNRTLARTVDFTQEFPSYSTEIILACYPVESITRFELKTTEAEGWVEQTDIECLVRSACIISLSEPLSTQVSGFRFHPSARVIYAAGFVLPGTVPAPGQTALPSDLEQACTEQVAFWFQTRETLGARTYWPTNGTYQQFVTTDLLPAVRAILAKYTRYSL